MKRWPTRPLGEFAEVIRGVSFDKSQVFDAPGQKLVPILRAGNIQDSLLTDSDLVFVPAHLVSPEQRMRRGDLAVCMSSGSPAIVGKSAHLEADWDGSVGAFCAIVRFREKLHHRFGSYWFRSPAFMQWRDNNAKGANIQNLRRTELENLSVPVPPLAEQERIVKLLDEADELRKLRAQADRRTASLIPSLFHEMFGDPEHTRLSVKLLIELVVQERPITYGILKPGPDIEGGIPYVRVLDIKQSRLHVEQLRKTTKEIAHQYRRSTLRPGDILVTIRGTVGRTCIVPNELTGANITQDTARLAIIPRLEPVYVVEFLSTPWAQSWMNHHTQGQAVKGINLGDLKKLPVPVPPLSLQKEFAARVSEIRAVQAEQTASRRRLDDLFQSMLHRAFNGEL